MPVRRGTTRPLRGRLVPINIAMWVGDSNTAGARNALTELPTGVYPADTGTLVYDDVTANDWVQLVPGPLEQQPGGASYVDATFTNTVGPCGRFTQIYRTINPTRKLGHLISQQGGGRFSDLASRGRAANYLYNLTDGAYNEMKVSFQAALARLASLGYAPNTVFCRIALVSNTAQDATESTNLATNLTNLIAKMRADGLLQAGTKILLDRVSTKQTDLSNSTNNTNCNNAVASVAAADPTHIEVHTLDGMPVVSSLGGPDSIHFTAGAQHIIGEQAAFHALGEWYPQKENVTGGNAALHEWRPGDYRNTITSSTTTSGALQTMFDCAGAGHSPSQATAGKRPAIGSVTPANGLAVRYAAGDGVDDALVYASGASLLTSAAYALCGAVKGAALANGTLIGEGGTNANAFVNLMQNDASGNGQFRYRDDAGTVTGPTTLSASVYNGSWNAFAMWESGGTINDEVNGTAGTSLPYTRGTVTLNRKSFWGLNFNAGAAEIHYGTASAAILWQPTSVPDATYKSNARTYMQRWWGTA